MRETSGKLAKKKTMLIKPVALDTPMPRGADYTL